MITLFLFLIVIQIHNFPKFLSPASYTHLPTIQRGPYLYLITIFFHFCFHVKMSEKFGKLADAFSSGFRFDEFLSNMNISFAFMMLLKAQLQCYSSLLWHSFHVFTIWKLEKICFGFFRRVVVSSLDLYKFFNIQKWKIYNSTRPSLILWLQEARLQVKKAEYCVSHRVKKSSPSSETEKDREISRKNEQKTCVKVVRFERQPRIRKVKLC